MNPNYEDIGNALRRQEFHLFYQPKYEMSANRIVGLEALLRWKSETGREYINPDDFIPFAEETGIITEITLYVVNEVCRFISECKNMMAQCVPVSINLSRIDLCNPFFIPMFMEAIQSHGIDPCYIEAEITETAFSNARDAMLFQIKRLRQYGIRIAIDDFGTGYSSLAFLKSMPVDILKIDRMFMQDISTDKQGQGILKSVLGLADTLALDIVIEGIETKEEAEYIKAQGCNIVQGYYFSKPVSKDEILQMLCRNAG